LQSANSLAIDTDPQIKSIRSSIKFSWYSVPPYYCKVNPNHSTIMKKINGEIIVALLIALLIPYFSSAQTYKIVDTGQEVCFDTLNQIPDPLPGEAYYGQDAQFDGNQPAYQDNGDGTVSDLVTGLMWQKNLYAEKMTYDQAVAGADTCSVGGYGDWRLPTIKELYSLIDFRGLTSVSAETSVPFINTDYFEFRYGDETAGERFIDAQYASSTTYVGTTMNGNFTMFGVNFADGRIKGYPTETLRRTQKTFEVKYVRGNPDYGINDFSDNGDGTVTDSATGLMWCQEDNGTAVKWEEALAWVQQQNAANYLGYSDWRLPNAKELQSIVDYTRSPQTSNSAAIDPVFQVTTITDEGGGTNYPFYWTGTTHGDGGADNQYAKAVYVAFGEALGFMEVPPNSGNYLLMDVHGAGAQRSDPKFGDPANFPFGFGPQGDVIRIFNYVRMVRDLEQSSGVNEIKMGEFDLKVYPNPVKDVLTIKIESSSDTEFKVDMISLAGKKVYSSIIDQKEFKINTNAFAPGFYFLQITRGTSMATAKVLVQ